MSKRKTHIYMCIIRVYMSCVCITHSRFNTQIFSTTLMTFPSYLERISIIIKFIITFIYIDFDILQYMYIICVKTKHILYYRKQ